MTIRILNPSRTHKGYQLFPQIQQKVFNQRKSLNSPVYHCFKCPLRITSNFQICVSFGAFHHHHHHHPHSRWQTGNNCSNNGQRYTRPQLATLLLNPADSAPSFGQLSAGLIWSPTQQDPLKLRRVMNASKKSCRFLSVLFNVAGSFGSPVTHSEKYIEWSEQLPTFATIISLRWG